MQRRDHRVREGALVGEDVRRTRTQHAPDARAIHAHLPGIVRKLVVPWHGAAVMGGAMSEGTSLLVREQHAVRLAGGAVRGERGAVRRHALDRLDPASGQPDLVAGTGELAVHGHQALELGPVAVDRTRIPHDHERPRRLCRHCHDRYQERDSSFFHLKTFLYDLCVLCGEKKLARVHAITYQRIQKKWQIVAARTKRCQIGWL